ncbi:MAG: helix-turn-helix domain-containing protein [Anaerolineae bacterium]|nr:helix-turn-helix domain-containing protein [Anaerolineae bacterium]
MYSDEMRRQAVKMYADGAGFRQVARQFEIDHVTVMNWVKAHIDQLLQLHCQRISPYISSRWTSCTLLWVRKKQTLPRDFCGAENQLYCGVAGCYRA